MPTPDEAPPTCPNCHEAVPGGARLCPNCGTSLAEPDADAPIYETQSRTGDIVLGVLAGMIFPPLLATVLGYAIWFLAGSPSGAAEFALVVCAATLFWFAMMSVLSKSLKKSRVLVVIIFQKMLVGWLWLAAIALLGLFATCIVNGKAR